MKIVITIVILLLLPVTGPSKKGVNYEHKKIAKEIAVEYKIEPGEFSTDQIIIVDGIQPADSGRYYNLNVKDTLAGYLYVGRVFTCPVGGCDNPSGYSSGSFEYFDYLIIFDTSFKLLRTTVFNYQASHGQEICSRGWLNQFKGYDGTDNLRVGKEIDSISGATKSTNSITDNVMLVREILVSTVSQ